MKKFLKYLYRTLEVIVLLPILLVVALYLPPVQNWVAHLAAEIASEKTGMNISVGHVGISFPLDIDLEGLTAIQAPDTLLSTGSVIVDLNFDHIMEWRLGVDGIDIKEGTVNTLDLIDKLRIRGQLGLLHLDADNIDFKNKNVTLNNVLLDDSRLLIAMRDTTIIDTTESKPLRWTLDVKNIKIRNSYIAYHSAKDTIVAKTAIRYATLGGGDIHLENKSYNVGKLKLGIDSLFLSMMDSVGSRKNIRLPETDLAIKDLKLDTVHAHVGYIDLVIHPSRKDDSESYIRGSVDMDFNAFTPKENGHTMMDIKAQLQKNDLMLIAGDYIPSGMAKYYPTEPLKLRVLMEGNIDNMTIDTLRANMSKVADVRVDGVVRGIMNPDTMFARLDIEASTANLTHLARAAGVKDVALPPMSLSANAKVDGHCYETDALLRQAKGRAHLKARLNSDNVAYAALANVQGINVKNFLPKNDVGTVSCTAKASGVGTDMLSRSTRLKVMAVLRKLQYGKYDIGGVKLDALLKNGHGSLDITSDNDIIKAEACAQANISRKISDVDFSLDLNRIDFRALGLVKDTLTASMIMHLDANSNLKDKHRANASIQAMELLTEDSVYHPLDIDVGLELRPDTIHVWANDGDLSLDASSRYGIDRLLNRFNSFKKELQRQLSEHYIDQPLLKTMLPDVRLHLNSGRTNPVGNIMRSLGYDMQQMVMDANINPEDGVNTHGYMYKLNTGSVCLDTIQLDITHPENGVSMLARVKNGPRNRVVDFEAKLSARLTETGFNAGLIFLDAKGRKGIDLGMDIEGKDSVLTAHLTPLHPVIAYRNFTVNEDNYISIDQTNHVRADLDLLADDGTGLKIYSTPFSTALQDITLSLNHLNLTELANVIPFMPKITGLLSGDLHVVKEEHQTTFSIDMNANQLTYEGTLLGNMGLNAVYMPNEDGSHYIDGILSHNDMQVAFLTGRYWMENDEGNIKGEARLNRLPLNIVNGFIPNKMARLEGVALGNLEVQGTTSRPILTGKLATDSLHIISDPYSINLEIPDDTVIIDHSRLDLDKIYAYAGGNSEKPLLLDGYVDFSNTDKIRMDMIVKAKDFNLINAKKSRDAQVYGKVYVDLNGHMYGTLQNLNINGNLHVGGKTDVTYVLKDSPLALDDQLHQLVTFKDFGDTIVVEEPIEQEQNINMRFGISIDEATAIHCLLDENGTDKVEIEGGGDLVMTYDMLDGIRLFGRYTILTGRMDYSMVVVSVKNCQIAQGSYVEFNGDVTNPTLNISASEKKKVTVTENNVPRSVQFDVGLNVTRTLNDLGLEFTIDAPEDMSIQNQLSSMGAEDRGRAAVTMLATGMYVTDLTQSNGSGFNTTNALNSFLQSQLSGITGKALSTVDIGFGIDNTQTATGSTQTDYNFSFAKRFWGNRVSVIIGGKVSSGQNANNTAQSIIDNVSVEYRLDKSGTRYVKAFYNKNQESLLEGNIMEMGASIVLRRKTENLGELFIFRNTKNKEGGAK